MMTAISYLVPIGIAIASVLIIARSSWEKAWRNDGESIGNGRSQLTVWRLLVFAACGIVAVRVATLWVILIAQWTRNTRLSMVPLVLLLYPEASWFPPSRHLTAVDAILCSVALIPVSFLLATPITAIHALIRWIEKDL